MNICIDSRKVREGDAFFCMEGVETDGHKYIDDAVDRGAKVIVHMQDLRTPKRNGVLYFKVDDTVRELNEACDAFYGFPSHELEVFGVTGTNGKSTITSIISQIYSSRKLCGYVGTISIRLGAVTKEAELTTPDTVTLHKSLKEMADEGAKAVAIEISSQGLSRGRVQSIDFDYAIFTNLTQDHLDYHRTMEDYFEAKQILFKNLKPGALAILNRDSFTYDKLAECSTCRHISYGIKNRADYMAEDIKYSELSTRFTLVHDGKKYPVVVNLAAEYNVYNLLAAIAAMHEAGMDIEEILEGVKHINQIPGRMERIDAGQEFNVIVDYAHTPDGFEKIFEYAKTITPLYGRIIGVFGADGGRDHSKRKFFGSIAEKYCDKIYITEADSRTEDTLQIARDIKEGITDLDYEYIENRYDAIEASIKNARKGDCILILSKGDEVFLTGPNGREEWMGDNVAAEKALIKYYKKPADDKAI